MKNIWNTYKSSFLLLAAMIIGGVVGMFWGEGASVLQPVADLFLNLLYCCVVPLIFCSLTSAIAKMEDLTKLRKILITFLVGTIVSGVIACLFMVIPSLIFDPGKGAVLDLTEDVADAMEPEPKDSAALRKEGVREVGPASTAFRNADWKACRYASASKISSLWPVKRENLSFTPWTA